MLPEALIRGTLTVGGITLALSLAGALIFGSLYLLLHLVVRFAG